MLISCPSPQIVEFTTKFSCPRIYAFKRINEGHKSTLEDFWANLQDSFEVREKNYCRLLAPQIRNFELFQLNFAVNM